MSRDDLIHRGDALDAFDISADPRGYIEKLIPPVRAAFSRLDRSGGRNVYSATVNLSLSMDVLADDLISARVKAANIINEQHNKLPEIDPDMVLAKLLYSLNPKEEKHD